MNIDIGYGISIWDTVYGYGNLSYGISIWSSWISIYDMG